MLHRFIAAGSVVLCAAVAARACDLCSIYAFLEAQEPSLGPYASVYEQYSDFGTLRLAGEKVPNPEGESITSSITQIAVGYQFSRRAGVQVNVPYVDRAFRRAREEGSESGGESGLGDVAAVVHWRPVERAAGKSLVIWSLLGGVKLATGDSDRLAEELEEDPPGEAPESDRGGSAQHLGEDEHGHRSGVHGHDLALGSGSLDGIVGTSLFISRGRLFVDAKMQYALRSEGDLGYRYADDLTWSVAPGWFVWLRHGRALSLGVQTFGERKGEDRLDGGRLEDTAITAVYAGPAIAYSHRGRLFAELRLDLPVTQDNSSLQLVPDSRLRLGLTSRF